MQNKLSSSICHPFWTQAASFRHLYKLLALVSFILIAAEIGSCGNETQNPQSNVLIAFKEENVSGVSINIKDKSQAQDQKSETIPQTKAHKVILDIKPIKQQTLTNDDPRQSLDQSNTTNITANISMDSMASTLQSSKATYIKFQLVDPSTLDSAPKPSASIVAQQAASPVAAAPIPKNQLPAPMSPTQVFPSSQVAYYAPAPQISLTPAGQVAMVPPIDQLRTTASESKDKNGEQSILPPAPVQVPQTLPPPPSLEGEQPLPGPTPPIPPDQKLGEAPPDTSLEFLRRQAVLLKPCEWQIDIGFSYLIFDNHFTDLTPQAELVETRLRRRLLTMPLEFRYGLCERVQLFANAPFGWANTEISRIGDDDFSNNGGIGDTNVGATFHIYQSDGTSCSPDVLATFGLTAPTGNGNALLGILETPDITLGQGFWAAFWNVLVIQKYDPVIVFYGVGSRHFFARDIESFNDSRPGDQFIYQLGTGFAINERITLSTTFFGSYITEARLNGQVLQGTILEPMYVRFATTITRPNKHICEPFVEIGLTDDSANARAGITWTF